jgi:hypothetical protein
MVLATTILALHWMLQMEDLLRHLEVLGQTFPCELKTCSYLTRKKLHLERLTAF